MGTFAEPPPVPKEPPRLLTPQEIYANNLSMVEFGKMVFSMSRWIPIFRKDLEEMNRGKVGRPYDFSDSLIYWILQVMALTGLSFRLAVGFAQPILGLFGMVSPSYSRLQERVASVAGRFTGTIPTDAEERYGSGILAVADPTEKMILYPGAGLGLRREEIATIKLSDFKGNKVLISGKGHGKGKLVEKEVPRSVQRVIEEYLPVREELIARYGDRNNGSLIAIPFRSHSPTAATRFVDETMRKLKGKTEIDATCHTLRRFYCTNLADAGTELDTLRRMMRHSHIDTTVNHYLKADPRKMKSATTAVDDALDL